jgi:hypothetical protein
MDEYLAWYVRSDQCYDFLDNQYYAYICDSKCYSCRYFEKRSSLPQQHRRYGFKCVSPIIGSLSIQQ